MIPVTRSSMPPMAEYFEEIASLWESRWLTNFGAKHQLFKAQLKNYLNVDHASLFANGHLALECAFEAFGLGSDGRCKVITTPFTFSSTIHAIVRMGLVPVFADIKPEDCTLDPASVETLVDDETCAIVPVHVYGFMCDVEAFEIIAKRNNLKVIYDAAHAFGVKRNGVSSAAFGDASMFSLHATKAFNSIEGGLLTFRDAELEDRLTKWKSFGADGPEEVVCPGGNAKMNEFCAAMGICNLRHLDEETEMRKKAALRYYERLSDIPGVRIFMPTESVEHNYIYMPVVFEDGFHKSRDQVQAQLAEEGILARKYFYPLASDYACYRNDYDSADTPVAKRVSNSVLTLPLYAGLTDVEVDRICDIVLK